MAHSTSGERHLIFLLLRLVPMMLTPRLQERLATFLPEIRVGIDFGESAGGIAVVRGNQILHAETYVDFHTSDLEQRRQLRRGRRTRHAKKMRLARLRSWVLRQKLPNDAKLPDPYVVMRSKQFHVQPGVFQIAGRNPADLPSWIDLAKQGKVDANGFVRALTLIFQKRGFKWDAIELAQMNDAKLKDFLQTARIPSDHLAADIHVEIERRRQDPDSSVCGKKKVSPDELLDLLAQARERIPRPRVAEHRSVKDADLRSAVEGFGNSINLQKATMQRWQQELSGLLNKVLRPARFDNRLHTGCAWCGKPTPRKSKVREVAYEAAVRNLRVREGRFIRPLKAEELTVFMQWWRLRGQAIESPQHSPEQKRSHKDRSRDVPKLKAIQSHLKKLGAQEQMARQISDLLWNETPHGRTSLCQQHLIEAAQGKTMKDVVGEWHKVKVRKAPNPCREQHDARVLHRLEQILFKPGKNGPDAWRHGPIQFITLEVPKPQTEQARKGEQKLRKPESFMERLRKETAGVCVYCDSSSAHPAEDKDHIFPQSRGGPDVWDNLVPVCRDCNTAKGDRTPFEWIGGAGERWQRFTERVEALAVRGVRVEREDGKEETIRISERKRGLFVSHNTEYPDNPTPLAHVGARPRQFVVALRQLFEDRGVVAPSVNFESGMPFVQRIDGRTTFQLRKSWLKKADGSDNFPKKNDWDLLNHAQDAALIAACPPHTWRDIVFRVRASRPRWDGKWTEQDGLAVPELAPDWTGYFGRRTWPLVRVLGKYPVSWKRNFADLTFYQNPEQLDEKKLTQHVPSDDQEEAPPGSRHVKRLKQPGGRLACVRPADGPARKVQLKGASEGIVFWVGQGDPIEKLQWSISWPSFLGKFGIPRHDPPIPQGARILALWRRRQMIRLGQHTGHVPGFYRVKEFSKNGVIVLPENSVTDELAKRLNLKKRRPDDGAPQSPPETQEAQLGKKVLAKYFQTTNGETHHDPGPTA